MSDLWTPKDVHFRHLSVTLEMVEVSPIDKPQDMRHIPSGFVARATVLAARDGLNNPLWQSLAVARDTVDEALTALWTMARKVRLP